MSGDPVGAVIVAIAIAYISTSLMFGFGNRRPKRIGRVTLRIGRTPGGAR